MTREMRGKGLPPYGPCYPLGRQTVADMGGHYASNKLI
jgi:hypothetical protein